MKKPVSVDYHASADNWLNKGSCSSTECEPSQSHQMPTIWYDNLTQDIKNKIKCLASSQYPISHASSDRWEEIPIPDALVSQ